MWGMVARLDLWGIGIFASRFLNHLGVRYKTNGHGF